MSYFWIILIVLIALSPLIKAMPTRRQRNLANLRQAASAAGLFVQYRNSPLADPDEPQRVYYGRRRGREHARVGNAAIYQHDESGWSALQGSWTPARLSRLAALPSGISVVSEELADAGVFWDERGTVEDVELINVVLKGLLESTD